MEAAAVTGVPTSAVPAGIPVAALVMAALTLHPNCRGRCDESVNVLTLDPIADESVSRKGGDKNFGSSRRPDVANNSGGEW